MSRSRKPRPQSPKADPDRLRDGMREVREVYTELAARPSERDCRARTECCRFRLTGRTPQLTRGEALVAAAGWRAAGRRSLPVEEASDGACPFLGESGRCQIYESRPFGCRTHFCAAAGGMIERGAVVDLIHRLEAIDESLGGDGPRPLRNAVAEIWEESARSGRKKRGPGKRTPRK